MYISDYTREILHDKNTFFPLLILSSDSLISLPTNNKISIFPCNYINKSLVSLQIEQLFHYTNIRYSISKLNHVYYFHREQKNREISYTPSNKVNT